MDAHLQRITDVEDDGGGDAQQNAKREQKQLLDWYRVWIEINNLD